MEDERKISAFNAFFSEVQKEWVKVAKASKPNKNLDLELQLYKKMLELVQVGTSYYFVFVPPLNMIERVSPSITDVLGWEQHNFTLDHFVKSIHPDDLPTFVEFEKKVVEFKMKLSPDKLLKYKSRYNYRIQKSDGTYLPILQQSITIQTNEEGAVIRNFIIHTDISEYKTDTMMKLSFVGLEGEPSFLEIAHSPFRLKENEMQLTDREAQILLLLSQNYNSNEIADKLYVSTETIRTHRKNMMKKTGTTSTLQLVLLAKDKGWL